MTYESLEKYFTPEQIGDIRAEFRRIASMPIERCREENAALRRQGPLLLRRPEPSIAGITRIVAAYYGVSVASLRERDRHQPLARARQIALALAAQYTKKSLASIARYFCDIDRSSLYHARKLVAYLEEVDPDFSFHLNEIRKEIMCHSHAVGGEEEQ